MANFTSTGSEDDIVSKNSSVSLSKGAVIGIAIGCGTAGLIVMATLFVHFFLRKLTLARKTSSLQSPSRSDSGLRGCLCSWRESLSHRSMSGELEEAEEELVHLSSALSFSLEELLRASAYVLGKNGVGIVYKAVLDEGTVVAVRRLGAGGEQRQKEFEAEVKSIAQVRHPHVVCLHSFSWTTDEKLLIYDYLPNGSLEMALHGKLAGFHPKVQHPVSLFHLCQGRPHTGSISVRLVRLHRQARSPSSNFIFLQTGLQAKKSGSLCTRSCIAFIFALNFVLVQAWRFG